MIFLLHLFVPPSFSLPPFLFIFPLSLPPPGLSLPLRLYAYSLHIIATYLTVTTTSRSKRVYFMSTACVYPHGADPPASPSTCVHLSLTPLCGRCLQRRETL